MKRIKGVIFDYGGTLDTNGVHWFQIFRRAYAECFPQVAEEQLRSAYVYAERYLAAHRVIEPEDDFLAMLRKKVDIQLSCLSDVGCRQAVVGNRISLYCDALVRRNMEHTRDILAVLAARYPLVLVSNFYGNIHAVLHSYGIQNYFKDVIESAVVGVRKPDQQIFLFGVEALGLYPEEVLVVGDSYEKDIVPASTLGCRTIWLKGQGWNAADDVPESICADRVIDSLEEILPYIGAI